MKFEPIYRFVVSSIAPRVVVLHEANPAVSSHDRVLPPQHNNVRGTVNAAEETVVTLAGTETFTS